jgi:hypothetical protein
MYHRTEAVVPSPNIRAPCGRQFGRRSSCQQPDGGDTPGVAVAPVALAGAIVPGVDRFIVMLSAHADVFGVGITAIAMLGSMLVPPSPATSGVIVPGGGLAGICGVESGSAAPLVGGPPGVELHTVVDGLPSGDVDDISPVVLPTLGVEMVPIVLPTPGVEMVPNGAAGVIATDGIVVAVLDKVVGTGTGVSEGTGRAGTAGGGGAGTVELGNVDRNDVAGCAPTDIRGVNVLLAVDVAADGGAVAGVGDIDEVSAVAPPTADIDATGTGGSPGAICPVGVAQVTTVPGVVGSVASGTAASVVSGAPGWVVAENGLGPLSGEVTIAPGVDARPIAVVPMVETCAKPASQPPSRMRIVNTRPRIAIVPLRRSSWSVWPGSCAPQPWRLPPDSPSDSG